MLNLCQFHAPFRRLTGMLQIAARITAIAFLELRDCFGRSYRRLVRVSRISGSGKLACAKQTDYDEARCDYCFLHAGFMSFFRSCMTFAACCLQRAIGGVLHRHAIFFDVQRILRPKPIRYCNSNDFLQPTVKAITSTVRGPTEELWYRAQAQSVVRKMHLVRPYARELVPDPERVALENPGTVC